VVKRSAGRILTTHTGSLPRPAPLREALARLDRGQLTGAEADRLPELVTRAVADVVPRQIEAGIDVINDGELGKVSYARYAARRLSGFGGRGEVAGLADLDDFPGWRDRIMPSPQPEMPACIGPVQYTGTAELEADLANLLAATRAHTPAEAFLSAVSPGVLALFFQNRFYATQEEYLFALADAMKHEYDAICAAGLVLQVDCPDLARGRHQAFARLSDEEWRRQVRLHLLALEHAIRDIPAERLRMHVCWGNYEGPHHRDVPLRDVLELVLEAKPAAIAFEAANPRHEHEWRVFEDLKLPEGKVLIPGVIDSTTNYIEHPELVAQRLLRFTGLAEHVIAGTDCGFATGASTVPVDPDIAWAKLRALAEGARLASRETRA
jgi:5-methyltetrahydropteroyltriglutamate--homocysteine methyltransferase